MQEYLNHFLGNLDIVNLREVPRRICVSSFILSVLVEIVKSIHHNDIVYLNCVDFNPAASCSRP
jgi:hypothetical protein